jgi:hypothetical protein
MLIFLPFLLGVIYGYDWQQVDKVITDAINQRVFPGGVLIVTNASATLYQNAYGTLTYKQDIFE